MKLLRWIAPPILAVLNFVTVSIVVGIVALQFGSDTGYGGLVECIVIGLLVWLIAPCLYSATLLRDCKHRICYTLYCSFIMGVGICITSNIVRGSLPNSDDLLVSAVLFVCSEIGALLGLIRIRSPK